MRSLMLIRPWRGRRTYALTIKPDALVEGQYRLALRAIFHCTTSAARRQERYVGLVLSGEADPPLGRLGRNHKLANGVEYHLELPVVFGFERVEPARQLAVFADQCAQPYEGSHDFDVHSHRLLALQYGRQHRDALLGEGVRPVLGVP